MNPWILTKKKLLLFLYPVARKVALFHYVTHMCPNARVFFFAITWRSIDACFPSVSFILFFAKSIRNETGFFSFLPFPWSIKARYQELRVMIFIERGAISIYIFTQVALSIAGAKMVTSWWKPFEIARMRGIRSLLINDKIISFFRKMSEFFHLHAKNTSRFDLRMKKFAPGEIAINLNIPVIWNLGFSPKCVIHRRIEISASLPLPISWRSNLIYQWMDERKRKMFTNNKTQCLDSKLDWQP